MKIMSDVISRFDGAVTSCNSLIDQLNRANMNTDSYYFKTVLLTFPSDLLDSEKPRQDNYPASAMAPKKAHQSGAQARKDIAIEDLLVTSP